MHLCSFNVKEAAKPNHIFGLQKAATATSTVIGNLERQLPLEFKPQRFNITSRSATLSNCALSSITVRYRRVRRPVSVQGQPFGGQGAARTAARGGDPLRKWRERKVRLRSKVELSCESSACVSQELNQCRYESSTRVERAISRDQKSRSGHNGTEDWVPGLAPVEKRRRFRRSSSRA